MVKAPLKYLPIAGIFFLLCIIGYYLVKAGVEGVKKPILDGLLPEARLTVKNFHSSQDNLILDADEGIYSQDRQQVTLNKFVLKIESLDNPSMKITSMEIKGNRADWDTNLKVINLSGNLQGNSREGYKIFTERLIYNYDEEKESVLKTDEPVRITGPFFSMSGKGLIFYTEKETIEIISDITGFIELTERGPNIK